MPAATPWPCCCGTKEYYRGQVCGCDMPADPTVIYIPRSYYVSIGGEPYTVAKWLNKCYAVIQIVDDLPPESTVASAGVSIYPDCETCCASPDDLYWHAPPCEASGIDTLYVKISDLIPDDCIFRAGSGDCHYVDKSTTYTVDQLPPDAVIWDPQCQYEDCQQCAETHQEGCPPAYFVTTAFQTTGPVPCSFSASALLWENPIGYGCKLLPPSPRECQFISGTIICEDYLLCLGRQDAYQYWLVTHWIKTAGTPRFITWRPSTSPSGCPDSPC